MLERRFLNVLLYVTLALMVTMFGTSIYNYFCEQTFIRIDDSCVQIIQGFNKNIICHQTNPYVLSEDCEIDNLGNIGLESRDGK